MSNSKKKCRSCNKYFLASSGILAPLGFFHSDECRYNYFIKNQQKVIEQSNKLEDKRIKAWQKEKRKEIRTRSDWYEILQKLVNQWVVHVRDKGKPCCTCGTTKPNIQYDAGHFFTRAARPDIRFELTNIHKQCSVRCNQHGSGMRKEYTEFIKQKYGEAHLKWLEERKPLLKDQFKEIADIERECQRYRQLLKKAGIRYRV